MAPPKYDDLGKDSKDLLNKSYNFGAIKLEGKTLAANGKTEFVSEFTHDYTESGAVGATLESKWKGLPYGLSISEKWNTQNVILSKITCDKIANLTLDGEVTFAPSTGKKSAKVKATHQSVYTNVVGDVDLLSGPAVNLSAVFGYGGLLAGYQASYDTGNSKLTKNNVALAYKGGDYTLHGSVVDATKFTCSLHHSVNAGLAVGAQMSWAAGGDSTSFTVGMKKEIDADASVKAKIDNNLRVGLSYTQTLRPGLSATLSGLLNGKEATGHKFGLHLNLTA